MALKKDFLSFSRAKYHIPLGLLEQYATKGAKQRDDNKLNQALQRIILYNLKTINEKLS